MKSPKIPMSDKKGSIMIIPYFGRFANGLCTDPDFQKEVLAALASYDAGTSFVILHGIARTNYNKELLKKRDRDLRNILVANQKGTDPARPNWTNENIVTHIFESEEGKGFTAAVPEIISKMCTISRTYFSTIPFDIDIFTAPHRAKIWKLQLTHTPGLPELTCLLEETPGRSFRRWQPVKNLILDMFGIRTSDTEPQRV